MAKKYNIHIKKSKEGSLHSALHVPQGEKIPSSKLKIKSTDSPALKKKKQFAINAKKFKHQAGGQQQDQSDTSQFEGISDTKDEQLSNPGTMNPPSVNSNFANTPQGQKLIQKYKSMGYTVQPDPQTGKINFTKNLGLKDNPLTKDFNEVASVATGIGNTIQNSRLKHDEKLKVLNSMTPKFLQNMEASGLDNVPAYTMYGGGVHGEGTSIGIYDHSVGPNFGQYSKGVDSDISSRRTESDVPMPTFKNKETEESGYEGINHDAFYGDQSIYRTGGSVSSTKAKEILHDGTIHGQPITDKQRRYFGWIAGGSKAQTGGQSAPAPQQAVPVQQPTQNTSLDDYYKSNATLSYYKNKLNDKLKAKNPDQFTNYFKGLQTARKSGDPQNSQKYIQDTNYDQYLTPEEVQGTLGNDDYQKYIQSLKSVNTYNVKQGQQPLYGTQEGGDNDPTKLNYGRRFASLQVTPSFSNTVKSDKGDKTYSRNYNYNPQTGNVDFTEQGDLSVRPQEFSAPAQQALAQQQQQPPVASKKYGGRKYQVGGSAYNVGDELELTDEQIKQLKKQGYKIKTT